MKRVRCILAVGTLLALPAWLALGCAGKVARPSPGSAPTRTYRMGFSAIPPRPDLNLLLSSIQMWSLRADAAIMHEEPMWDSLLAGVPADSLVIRNKLPLANFFRGLGLDLVVMVDVTNGLDRSAEAPALVAAGRSLTEPAIRQLYRRWCVAVDSLLRPDQMGLAAETNLIRAAAPTTLYQAVVTAANGAALAVRTTGSTTPLFVSVQVEVAWGWGGGGGSGSYVGIAQDLNDFTFMSIVGLSSYPYFVWPHPDSLPPDYYARIRSQSAMPVMVVEGGWTSTSIGGFTSSPAIQSRYVARHAELLDAASATAVFQLTFTDLDTTALNLPPGSILPLFSALGLVDETLTPKPALTPWDQEFARPRQ